MQGRRFALSQRDREGHDADPAREHQKDQYYLGKGAERGRYPRREPHGRNGGNHFYQRLRQRDIPFRPEQRETADYHQYHVGGRSRARLAHQHAAQPFFADVHFPVPPRDREGGKNEKDERRYFDAARGRP